MDDDSAFILKSIRGNKKFVGRGKSRENGQDNIRNFPNFKLNITDSFGLDLDNSIEGNDDLTNTSSFLQKHQQNIAGFDIAQKLGEKERQILECKTTISVLEGKHENLKSLYKNTRIEYESEIENYKTKQFQDKEKIEILEEKVKKLTEQKHNDQDEMFKNREMGEFHRSQKEKSLVERNKFYADKVDELQKKLTNLEEAKFDLMNRINEKSNELEIQKNENKMMEEKISNLESQVADLQSIKRDFDLLETKLHQSVANNKELESRLDCLKEQENKLHLFEDTIMKLPLLQKEITKLKEENNMHKITRLNIDLLKEQLTSAENRLQLMEIKCRDLTGENATLVTLRDLSEEYESVIMKEFEFEYLPPVSEFLDILKNLKKRDEEIEQSLNELRASIESHRSSKEKQEEINKNIKAELEECHFEMTKNAAIIRRLQRKIFLLSKERESLQSVMESYETEAAILNPSAVKQERIEHLETQLSHYRKEASELEEELNKAQQLPKYESKSEDKGGSTSEISYSNKEIDEDESYDQLMEENEMLKAEIEQYKNSGVHDQSKDKVIHFRENPLEKAYNERKASYDKLHKENEALKKEIKLLKERLNGDLITENVGKTMVTTEANSIRIKELEEEVKSYKRMLEAFKEDQEPQELRDVVCDLLGYRIDFEEDKCYKLTNIYAESQDDDYLLFKQNSNGEMELEKNEFSDSLDDIVKSYLYRDNSFPAFLSSITLDMHGRQTAMHSSDQEEEEYEGGEEDEEEVMGDDEEEFMGEEEEEEEESSLEPAAKRPRHDFEDEDPEEEEDEEGEEEHNEEEEEEDDDEELICLD